MSPAIDPFDELAAIFLTAPDEHPTDEDLEARTTIDLLVVGHLPVRAGLWLTPCADALARQGGPTALLRLDAAQPTLQLLRGQVDAARALSRATLEQAVCQLAGITRRWLIRTATGLAPDAMLDTGADRVTILSSADDAAVVAAYQIIKNIATAASDRGRPVPAFGLAVVGADEASARAVVRRLNRATSSFVGVELPLVLCLPRMDAGVASTCYLRFADEPVPSARDVVGWITQIDEPGEPALEAGAGPETPGGDEGWLGPEADAPIEAETADHDARVPPRPAAAEAMLNEDRADVGTPAPHAMPAPRAVRDDDVPERTPLIETVAGGRADPPNIIKLQPKAGVGVELKEAAREPADEGAPVDLSSYVPGLTVMPLRCPGHERVELALDERRRLHLLGREDALREMPVVEAWARRHHEILTMACPQHVIDRARPAVLHVFTAEPVRVADLHGSDVYLHVLAPVAVGEQRGWYAAVLNVPGTL